MSDPTAVDRLYREASELLKDLEKGEKTSLYVSAADNLRKSLLLAAASYFEIRTCSIVIDFIRERAKGSILVEQFVRNKAVSRQFHTWFKWDDNNANHFYGLFGKSFRDAMDQRLKKSEELRDSVRSFLEIGSERNRLIHTDYATYPLEKTMEEIYKSYQSALPFLEILPIALRECDEA